MCDRLTDGVEKRNELVENLVDFRPGFRLARLRECVLQFTVESRSRRIRLGPYMLPDYREYLRSEWHCVIRPRIVDKASGH